MLKYHVQTSGRSLHAREISFNDIRTTLQALYALFDNCNSLHTNAYDEALTTPTEESVRRAVAIQLIINRELGLNKIQNPWQGSFAIEYLTDLVEEAVYKEFEALSERGGVLGAMETMYQRGKIQEESLYYETRKHDGSLPIVGVNTFLSGRRCRRASTRGRSSSAPPRRRSRIRSPRCAPSRRAMRRARRRRSRALQQAAAARRQRVRRAHGVRQGLLAGADLARAVPGGRSVSSQHVRSGSPELREDRRARALAQLRRTALAGVRGRGRAAAGSPARSRPGSGRRRPAAGRGACRAPPPAPAGSRRAPRWRRRRCGNFSRPGVRVKVPSGKNTSESPWRALRSTRRASRGAALAVEALDELRAQPPQQRAGERHRGHLALDDEAEARRQRRGEHDAVEVAGVIAHHHALPGRQAFGEAHA